MARLRDLSGIFVSVCLLSVMCADDLYINDCKGYGLLSRMSKGGHGRFADEAVRKMRVVPGEVILVHFRNLIPMSFSTKFLLRESISKFLWASESSALMQRDFEGATTHPLRNHRWGTKFSRHYSLDESDSWAENEDRNVFECFAAFVVSKSRCLCFDLEGTGDLLVEAACGRSAETSIHSGIYHLQATSYLQ